MASDTFIVQFTPVLGFRRHNSDNGRSEDANFVCLNFYCNLQFHRHHSYFRKDFQMLLAHKKGEI